MTHWILQNNIYSEEGFESLIVALERFGFSYSLHKCAARSRCTWTTRT